jgi:hypothetical protein
MPRVASRLQLADAAFHIINRGHNRDTVFTDAEDYHAFPARVARYHQQAGLRQHHYWLMSNLFDLGSQADDRHSPERRQHLTVHLAAPWPG